MNHFHKPGSAAFEHPHDAQESGQGHGGFWQRGGVLDLPDSKILRRSLWISFIIVSSLLLGGLLRKANAAYQPPIPGRTMAIPVPPLEKVSLTISNLNRQATYYFAVVAFDTNQVESDFSVEVFGRTTNGMATLEWDPVPGNDIAGYYVYFGATSRYQGAYTNKFPMIEPTILTNVIVIARPKTGVVVGGVTNWTVLTNYPVVMNVTNPSGPSKLLDFDIKRIRYSASVSNVIVARPKIAPAVNGPWTVLTNLPPVLHLTNSVGPPRLVGWDIQHVRY